MLQILASRVYPAGVSYSKFHTCSKLTTRHQSDVSKRENNIFTTEAHSFKNTIDFFLYPWKQNLWFSDVFKGNGKKLVTWNELTNFVQLIFWHETGYLILSLVSFYTSWKHKDIRGFLMFSGGTEKNQWHKMVYKRRETNTRWFYFISTIFCVPQLGDKFMGYEWWGGKFSPFSQHI